MTAPHSTVTTIDPYHTKMFVRWLTIWNGIGEAQGIKPEQIHFENFTTNMNPETDKPYCYMEAIPGMLPFAIPYCPELNTQSVFNYFGKSFGGKITSFLSGEAGQSVEEFIDHNAHDTKGHPFDCYPVGDGYLFYAFDAKEPPAPHLGGNSAEYFRNNTIPTMTLMERLLFDIYRRVFKNEYVSDPVKEPLAYQPDFYNVTFCPDTHEVKSLNLIGIEAVPSCNFNFARATVEICDIVFNMDRFPVFGARTIYVPDKRKKKNLTATSTTYFDMMLNLWCSIWERSSIVNKENLDFSTVITSFGGLVPIPNKIPVMVPYHSGLTIDNIVAGFQDVFKIFTPFIPKDKKLSDFIATTERDPSDAKNAGGYLFWADCTPTADGGLVLQNAGESVREIEKNVNLRGLALHEILALAALVFSYPLNTGLRKMQVMKEGHADGGDCSVESFFVNGNSHILALDTHCKNSGTTFSVTPCSGGGSSVLISLLPDDFGGLQESGILLYQNN